MASSTYSWDTSHEAFPGIMPVPISAPASRRKQSAWIRNVAVIFEILGLILLVGVAGYLRFGGLYILDPDFSVICEDPSYQRVRRDPVIDISSPVVAVIVVVGPAVLIPLLELVWAQTRRLRYTKEVGFTTTALCKRLLKVLLLFLLGLSISSATTDFLRLIFSRPTPYFLNEYYSYCTKGDSSSTIMNAEELDARLSFPSYRCTMLAFAGALVAVLAELVLRTVPGTYAARPILATVALIPSLLAASQAVYTRESHWEDVAVGLALGAVMGSYWVLVLFNDHPPIWAAPPRSIVDAFPSKASAPGSDTLRLELPRAKIWTPSIEAFNQFQPPKPDARQISHRLNSNHAFD